MDDYLTIPEAAALVGYHPCALVRALRTQRVPITRRGGRWWVHRRDLDDFRPRPQRKRKTPLTAGS